MTPEVEARQVAALGLARVGYAITQVYGVGKDGVCHCPAGAACEAAGKHGGKGWMEQATRDPDTIRSRFLANDPGYGVVAQAGSRLVNVDEDVPGALEGLGPLPRTFTVETGLKADGARGRHVYGRLPAGIEESEIPYRWAGGEVRVAGNGQVIGPFSRHRSGVIYRPIDETPVDELPELWVRALIASARVETAERNTARGETDPGWFIEDPGRHPWLKDRARALRGVGMSGERLRDELRRLNAERCRPPKSEAEVDALAGWTNAHIGDDQPGVFVNTGQNGHDGPSDSVPPGEGQEPNAERSRPAFARSLEDFLAESSAGVEWAAEGIAVEGSLVAVLGAPESFKTMAMIQLGLALAGGAPWLGVALGELRPFIYVSNEKAGSTVRERFRLMTAGDWPSERVEIIHRRGVAFGHDAKWAELLAVVDRQSSPPVVVLDTLASLAGSGFNENDGKDMAVVLGRTRTLTDRGCLVPLLHHRNKHGDGVGGSRLRGHSSLHGEVDGVLEFTRADRARDDGVIRAEPKDGDLRIIRFSWNRETFLLEPETGIRIMTARTIAAEVELIYDGEPLTSDELAARFPGHRRSAFLDRLAEAVKHGLIGKTGGGHTTRYAPVAGRSPDDQVFEGFGG